MTKHWPVQDAKAKFSQVLRAAEKEPQYITYRGKEKGVLISSEEYHRLRKDSPDRTFYEIWKSAPKVPDFKIPKRKGRMRPVKF